MICRRFVVPREADGQRADVYLRKQLPSLTESALRALFEKRDVRLGGSRIRKGNTPLRAGMELLVYLPEDRDEIPDVVYEDADVLLVCKRPGLCVEADPDGGPSLAELCLRHVRLEQPDAPPPLPCHRLDSATSGLCLFAKNARAHEILLEVFRQRTLDKRYECLVRGIPKPPAALCRAYLLKDSEQARVRISDRPMPGGKTILTEYETLEAGPVSRLSVHLITGRTHQIRAHLAALGHPILGDDLYGDRYFNRSQNARTLKLCAVSLRLDTGGALPVLDGRNFVIPAPF